MRNGQNDLIDVISLLLAQLVLDNYFNGLLTKRFDRLARATRALLGNGKEGTMGGSFIYTKNLIAVHAPNLISH